MFTFEEPSMRPATVSAGAGSGRGSAGETPVRLDRRKASGSASLIDPVYVGRAVWNSKTLVFLTTFIGLVAATLVAVTTPKLYVATAQILMDPRDLKVVANEVTPNGLPSEATLALIESQTAVILSNNILSRVVEQSGLNDDAEFNGARRSGLASLLPASLSQAFDEPDVGPNDRGNRTVERLRRALTVGREAKSFVIDLSVGSSDPGKAAKLANMTADIFIDEQGRVQSDTARRATAALTSRLSELRRSVVETENNVEAYKSRNALIGVGGKLVDDEYITRINDQLAKARGDITALRVKADSMRKASVEDVVRGALPEEQTSQALVRLRQSYSDLAQQNAALATKLGPRHPQRIAGESSLASTRQAIASELGRIVAAAQTELARAEETERNLTSQIDALKDKQVATSGSFVKLRELEREVDASRAVYEAFLQRARETSEQENLNTANVRIISDAMPPLRTSGLSRKVVVAAGGLAGLLAGIALAAVLAVVRLLKAFLASDRRRAAGTRWPDNRSDRDDLPPPMPSEAASGPSLAPVAGIETASPIRSAGAARAPVEELEERLSESARLEAPDGEIPDGEAPQSSETAAPPSAAALERQGLRDRIRALSASSDGAAQRPLQTAFLDPEMAMLRDEVDTVRSAIAQMRRQRTGRSAES